MYQTTSVPSSEAVIQAVYENNEVIITQYYKYLKTKIKLKSLSGRYDSSLFNWAFQEAFNEAFLSLLEKIKSPLFQNQNLNGFAFKIIYGKTKDELDKLIRNRRYQEFDLQKNDHTETTTYYPTAKDWVENLSESKLADWYHSLSSIDRTIIELRYQDVDHKVIASELQLSIGTIRNKYSKLIREAKECIA